MPDDETVCGETSADVARRQVKPETRWLISVCSSAISVAVQMFVLGWLLRGWAERRRAAKK